MQVSADVPLEVEVKMLNPVVQNWQVVDELHEVQLVIGQFVAVVYEQELIELLITNE